MSCIVSRVETVSAKLLSDCDKQKTIISGQQGPPGATGGGVFLHTQSTPAAVWTINHNLGRAVSVTVYSVGGVEMWAEVIQPNSNQVLVYFDAAQSGTAICN